MTTSTPTTPEKIGFVHLGCPKNLVDTETMLGVLTKAGHHIVADEADATVMLVNTCAFLESAQRESVKHLVQLAEQGKKILVTGCLAQKFQDELLDVLPEAGAVIGTGNLLEVDAILRRVQQGERVVAVQQDPTYILEDDTQRHHITVGASVYVKIAEGCDYRCSFCIIPSMRGDFRSRNLQSLVNSVTDLVARGVTEVVLVGQDTTSYGKDINSSLPQLLRALNGIEGLQWLRFMYAYPNLVTDELLAAIRDCDKVVKYMDCPLQHTHPAILKRMRRPVMDHAAFAARVRAAVPGIKLRTSFIVGFPGETDEHYQHLKQTIEAVKWDRMGVFEYSDVDTAHSQTLDGKVPKATIKQRRGELMALQQHISYAANQQLVGQTLPVIIDSISPTGLRLGRTQWDAPEVDNAVMVKGHATPGDIVQVAIEQATPYDIKGTVVVPKA
jgi:ribosomal protein S12 methylthiotransferase